MTTTTRPASAPAAPVDIAPLPSVLLTTGADAARLAHEFFGKHIDAE